MYGISQSDLCILLGWGGKTITRYEGHQVQDKAHDTILKKIDRDSEWLLSLLSNAKDNLTIVIDKLGKMTKNQIVSFMHKEQAYIETVPRDIIQVC